MTSTDHELVALEHANWIAYLTGVVGCAGGAEVVRAHGVVTILTGLPFDWFNQVLVEGEAATSAGIFAGIHRARERGVDAVVRLRDGIDDRFVPTLIEMAMRPAGPGTTIPGMVAFPIDGRAMSERGAPGLEIRRVMDVADLDAHQQVVTAGFGSDPAVALGTSCGDLLERAGCALYLGFVDGEPVVSGLGWRTGRTIGVYSIATIPSARRHGYAAAMTARVVADGLAAGSDVAVLQASEMGRPIYERLGFRTAVRYDAYVGPRAEA